MSVLAHILRPDYMRQPPAFFHPRILVGAGAMLTPHFVLRHGITHVINCAHDEDSPTWWRTAFPKEYVVLNAYDNVYVNILSWWPVFEDTMQRFLREGTGVVFVHCQAGMNRSASLALAYCGSHFHMDMDSLVASVRRQRPVILQNQVFMNQVKEFVNGRLQSEKAERDKLGFGGDGNTGLSAPGDRPDSQRVEVYAGDFEDRVGEPEDGDLDALRKE